MDVLELPKPVINFLRTMSYEKEKYLLTWDLYGDGSSVTLSLTWKLADESSENKSVLKSTTTTTTSTLSSNNQINKSNINNKKSSDLNIIPPPSVASMIANKNVPDHKDSLSNKHTNKSDRFKTSSKTPVRFKDHNYYKIENNDYYTNKYSQNSPRASTPIQSCLYFPISSKNQNKNQTADISYKKNKTTKKLSSDNKKKSNSETNLNEDSLTSSESCEECKNNNRPFLNNDFTYRIVDYNLRSPVYKYKYKNARSIQNLNTYRGDANEQDEGQEKVENFLKKNPWIKNSNKFSSKI